MNKWIFFLFKETFLGRVSSGYTEIIFIPKLNSFHHRVEPSSPLKAGPLLLIALGKHFRSIARAPSIRMDRDDYLGFRNGLSRRSVEDREIMEARGKREPRERIMFRDQIPPKAIIN